MLEPSRRRQLGWIEIAPPVAILPARAADVNGWGKPLISQHLHLHRPIGPIESIFVPAPPSGIPLTHNRKQEPVSAHGVSRGVSQVVPVEEHLDRGRSRHPPVSRHRVRGVARCQPS